jgi:flagellar biosynthesis protein FlhA
LAEKLNQRNNTDLVIAIGVVAIILMLIIPLPTVLLDLFMSCNLLLSVLILLITLYVTKATDFTTFPTVLLVSTVFSLALNVSSTRGILSQGSKFDGKMVNAFGEFVVGKGGTDGLVIGLIIFIIFIAVQVMVITKGATRITEVQARFVLDAMPNKLMAIDAEFNAGTITDEIATHRKAELQKEIDFYSRMDGATKFISGAVKFGVLVTAINLIGGIILGMVLHGEPFSKAIQVYARFTIGDGLLSQIPSLLISVATGLIVTRSANDEKSSLGSTVKNEFTQNAWIYYVGGGTMAFIGVLPGFPWYILIPMGVLLVYLGYRITSIKKANEEQALQKEKEKQKKPSGPSAINPVVPLDPLSLELGYALVPLLEREKGGDLIERISRIRSELGLELGLVVPSIRVVDNIQIDPNEYRFKIRGVEVNTAKVRMGWFMCLNTGGVTQEIAGEQTVDPAFGLPALWVSKDNREKAELYGYSVIDSPTIIATHLTEMIKQHAADILDRQAVKGILDELQKTYSAVVDEVTKMFTVGEIQKVMQGLLRERVSIRNTVAILETMADYGSLTKRTDLLVEKVRQRLGRQICLQHCDDNKFLHIVTIEPSFIQKLIDSKYETSNGYGVMLDPVLQRQWIASLSNFLASAKDKGYFPVIVCSEEARILVKRSTEREMPDLVVLSLQEIDKEIRYEILGEVKVG